MSFCWLLLKTGSSASERFQGESLENLNLTKLCIVYNREKQSCHNAIIYLANANLNRRRIILPEQNKLNRGIRSNSAVN